MEERNLTLPRNKDFQWDVYFAWHLPVVGLWLLFASALFYFEPASRHRVSQFFFLFFFAPILYYNVTRVFHFTFVRYHCLELTELLEELTRKEMSLSPLMGRLRWKSFEVVLTWFIGSLSLSVLMPTLVVPCLIALPVIHEYAYVRLQRRRVVKLLRRELARS